MELHPDRNSSPACLLPAVFTNMTANRRQFVRFPIQEENQRAVLRWADQRVEGRLVDGSTGGFCLQVDGELALEPGTEAELATDAGSCQVQAMYLTTDGDGQRIGLRRLTDIVDFGAEEEIATERLGSGLTKPRWELLVLLPVAAICLSVFAGWETLVDRLQPAPQKQKPEVVRSATSTLQAQSTPAAAAVPSNSRKPHRAPADQAANDPAKPTPTTAASASLATSAVATSERVIAASRLATTEVVDELAALETPSTAAALQLSAEQRKTIRSLLERRARRMAELEVTAVDTSSQRTALSEQTWANVMDALSDEQRQLLALQRASLGAPHAAAAAPAAD